ncbi:hypothetical protein ACFVH6_36085 [Spirillospora sp. NPDC127200]
MEFAAQVNGGTKFPHGWTSITTSLYNGIPFALEWRMRQEGDLPAGLSLDNTRGLLLAGKYALVMAVGLAALASCSRSEDDQPYYSVMPGACAISSGLGVEKYIGGSKSPDDDIYQPNMLADDVYSFCQWSGRVKGNFSVRLTKWFGPDGGGSGTKRLQEAFSGRKESKLDLADDFYWKKYRSDKSSRVVAWSRLRNIEMYFEYSSAAKESDFDAEWKEIANTLVRVLKTRVK